MNKKQFTEYYVKLNEEGRKVCKNSPPERLGLVKGESPPGRLRIVWEGTKSAMSLSKSFVDRVDSPNN